MDSRSKNSALDHVFRAAPRAGFLPVAMRPYAHEDRPLPIGYGQTNSQPSLVRRMLRWLDAQPGDKVLDVGSGSGWTSALLGGLIGPDGTVDAVEKIPQLVDFGRDNADRLSISNVTFHQAGETIGLPNHAPYDRILVSAEAARMPPELLDQLRPGGMMVIPVGHDILVITKRNSGSIHTITHSGFSFVPLVA